MRSSQARMGRYSRAADSYRNLGPSGQRRDRGRAPAAAGGGLASFTGATFTEMMLTDLIPKIEKTYGILPGRENRAMAGLSMGEMQTFLTTLSNMDKFTYIGGFSGS